MFTLKLIMRSDSRAFFKPKTAVGNFLETVIFALERQTKIGYTVSVEIFYNK